MPDERRDGPCPFCANNPDRDHKPGEPWKPSPPACQTCRDSLNPMERPSNFRPLPPVANEKRDAEGENQQLRTALTNLVTTVCRESCGHEAPIGRDGYPACSSPCKELTEALELLRPKEASSDDHQG